jgi:RNA polymerase sigma-70 factor (ECF subfamily)
MELRDSWDPSVSPTAWCHAIAREVVRGRAILRRQYERQVLPLRENLYGAAMRLTRDPSDADDLVQDTMVRAWRFWESFEQGTDINAWMFTILRNTYNTGFLRSGRKAKFLASVAADMGSLGSAAAVLNSNSRPPGHEEMEATVWSDRRLIEEAIAKLPDAFRVAVTLRDLEHCTTREIAARMGCPIGTVLSRVYRGRALLHDMLHEHAVSIGMAKPDGANHRKPAKREAVVSGQCELFAAVGS